MANENEIDLSEIDLVATSCPKGTTIEIEGVGKMEVDLINTNLIGGIGHVLTIFTCKPTFINDDFEKRITVTDLDIERRYLKVRISD